MQLIIHAELLGVTYYLLIKLFIRKYQDVAFFKVLIIFRRNMKSLLIAT